MQGTDITYQCELVNYKFIYMERALTKTTDQMQIQLPRCRHTESAMVERGQNISVAGGKKHSSIIHLALVLQTQNMQE